MDPPGHFSPEGRPPALIPRDQPPPDPGRPPPGPQGDSQRPGAERRCVRGPDALGFLSPCFPAAVIWVCGSRPAGSARAWIKGPSGCASASGPAPGLFSLPLDTTAGPGRSLRCGLVRLAPSSRCSLRAAKNWPGPPPVHTQVSRVRRGAQR
ncbi:hypothetical protein NDU88_004474 [Pleurodeles waltl]|uniref:Uncharacterized protein n=1 Tax=Pleurodeles waltl TaxID=8319 RepID=A0AAV7W886_PLEWA|nr:hypothetical protein NDU88_004474 [Pleurodeles waltl]